MKRSYLYRLSRLHMLALEHEWKADPCTPARASRSERTQRIAAAYLKALKQQRHALEVAA